MNVSLIIGDFITSWVFIICLIFTVNKFPVVGIIKRIGLENITYSNLLGFFLKMDLLLQD